MSNQGPIYDRHRLCTSTMVKSQNLSDGCSTKHPGVSLWLPGSVVALSRPSQRGAGASLEDWLVTLDT